MKEIIGRMIALILGAIAVVSIILGLILVFNPPEELTEETAEVVAEVPEAVEPDEDLEAAQPVLVRTITYQLVPAIVVFEVVTNANVRAGPDRNAEALAVLPSGAMVSVIICGEWCLVEMDGFDGWVHSNLLEFRSVERP